MNMDEFIDSVFLRYPPKTSLYKPIEDFYGEYRNALNSVSGCDYQAAYNELITNYQYGSTPYPAVLVNYAKKHKKEDCSICSALQHIYDIKREKKADLYAQSETYRQNIRDKLLKLGVKTKIEAFK